MYFILFRTKAKKIHSMNNLFIAYFFIYSSFSKMLYTINMRH